MAVQFFFSGITISLTQRNKLKRFIETLFHNEHKELEQLNYIFCSDEFLLGINQQYLRHDDYTDIITFDLSSGSAINGEIYISAARVKENASSMKQTISRELHRVIFHGALHLCGYKDKTKKDQMVMRAAEEKYLSLYFG